MLGCGGLIPKALDGLLQGLPFFHDTIMTSCFARRLRTRHPGRTNGAERRFLVSERTTRYNLTANGSGGVMDKASLSRFPHLSWLTFRLAGSPGGSSLVLSMESVCHTVCCTFRGQHAIRQVTRGREVSWRENAGTVNVLPKDGEHHTFITHKSSDLDTVVFLIPTGQLQS